MSRAPGKVVTTGKAVFGAERTGPHVRAKKEEVQVTWETVDFGVEMIDGDHFVGACGMSGDVGWKFVEGSGEDCSGPDWGGLCGTDPLVCPQFFPVSDFIKRI